MKLFSNLKLLLIISTSLLLSSGCSTYNAPSSYQGKNLYKFGQKKYVTNKSVRKAVPFKRTASYWHPAVPGPVRKELRQRNWSERSGVGKL